jgi:hypothetical protein
VSKKAGYGALQHISTINSAPVPYFKEHGPTARSAWHLLTSSNTAKKACRNFSDSDVDNGCNRPIYKGVGHFLPHSRLVCYIRCIRRTLKNSDMALFAVKVHPDSRLTVHPITVQRCISIGVLPCIAIPTLQYICNYLNSEVPLKLIPQCLKIAVPRHIIK